MTEAEVQSQERLHHTEEHQRCQFLSLLKFFLLSAREV